ncbi:MAG: hypothetical protein ACHQCH_09245 [Solirubrobacterales bacterium]
MLLPCVLCLVCGTAAAASLAAPGHSSRHRPSHAARACHHTRHRRCHRKHKLGASSNPSEHTPRSASTGSGSSSTGASTTPVTPGPGATPPGPAGGAPPAESPTSPAAPAHVQVIAREYSFTLSRSEVPAGKVIVELANYGQDEHNLHATEPSEGSEAGSLPNTLPGAHPDLTLNLRPGSYTLFCSLKEHEAKGMKATLIVK